MQSEITKLEMYFYVCNKHNSYLKRVQMCEENYKQEQGNKPRKALITSKERGEKITEEKERSYYLVLVLYALFLSGKLRCFNKVP